MNEFDYLAKAKDKMENEKYHEVISLCEKALKINSELPDAYDFRGNAKYEIGEFESALEDFNELIKRDPNEAKHFYDRAWAYRQLDEMEDAIVDINSAIKLDPKTSILYFDKAIFEYDASRYKEALNTCNTAIELKPTENKYILRGKIYRELNDNLSALADFSTAIEIEPESFRAYYHRGSVKIDMNYFSDGIKDLEKTIEIYPGYSDAYVKIGMAKIETGQKGAMKYFNEAIKMCPDCTDFYKIRIVARRKFFKRQEVLQNLSINRDIDFNNDDKVFNEKQAKADIKDINKILSFEPDDLVSYSYRARRYEYLKQYSKAIADYTMLISLDPDEPWNYVMRAHCRERNGEYKDALDDCNKAIAMNNGFGNVTLFATRGVSNYKMSNYFEAYNDLSQVLEECKDSEVYYYLGLIDVRFGNICEAVRNFKNALEAEPDIESRMDEKIPLLISLILAFRKGLNKKIPKKINDSPIGLNGIR